MLTMVLEQYRENKNNFLLEYFVDSCTIWNTIDLILSSIFNILLLTMYNYILHEEDRNRKSKQNLQIPQNVTYRLGPKCLDFKLMSIIHYKQIFYYFYWLWKSFLMCSKPLTDVGRVLKTRIIFEIPINFSGSGQFPYCI